MSKGLRITLGVIGALFVLLFIGVSTTWSHRNTAVELEERIKAQHISNKSNYDNMWKSFKEIAQVTDMQAEHYKDVYTGLITGRNQDTNLLFKMIKEDNPKLDSSLYTKLQREISAGRKTFDNNQSKVTDMIREYNTFIKKKFIMASITGRKEMDANDYIITSGRTKKAFETGEDDVIDLSSNKK